MAESINNIKYIVEIDTKSGLVKIGGITKGFEEASTAARKLKNEMAQVNTKMGQGIDKTGLAGAAVVEMGRTISDSNYGFTAMANNISQLGTLMATLTVTTGGLTNGLRAMWAALKGPLGVIVIFQIIVTIFEKLAMDTKKVAKEIKRTRDYALELLGSEEKISTAMRKQLGIKKELNDEEAKALVAKKLALDVERIGLEIKLDDLEIQVKLAEFNIAMGKGDPEKLAELKERVLEVKKLLGLFDDDDTEFKRATVDNVVDFWAGAYEQAKITLEAMKETNPEMFDIDAMLMESATATLDGMEENLSVKNQIIISKAFELFNQQKALMALTQKEQDAADKIALNNKLKMFQAIGSGLQDLGFLLGESTQQGKAIAAAGALIDTYAAITGILKNTARTPAGAIPGYAIAQAIATGVFGFAQVKKIYDVKVPKGSGGGGAAGGVPSDVPIQQPDFNIVGVTRQNQIRSTITDALGKPVRAYITTKDVRSGAELDRNIVRGASVG